MKAIKVLMIIDDEFLVQKYNTFPYSFSREVCLSPCVQVSYDTSCQLIIYICKFVLSVL